MIGGISFYKKIPTLQEIHVSDFLGRTQTLQFMYSNLKHS